MTKVLLSCQYGGDGTVNDDCIETKECWSYKHSGPQCPPAVGGIVVDGLYVPEHMLHAKRGGLKYGDLSN